MQWKKVLCALALGAFASTALVSANPITDQSSTTLQVTPTAVTPYGDEEFSVTVQRVDDLMGDDGKVIAERIMDVKLNFDVKDDDILVNGVPISIGLSTIQIETAILVGSDAAKVGLTASDLKPAFDIGLAKIKVRAVAEKVLIDVADLADLAGADASTIRNVDNKAMIEIRRVVVAARIVEINGLDVVQSELVEQILDIFPAGSIRRSKPKTRPYMAGMPGIAYHPSAFDAEDAAENAHVRPCHRGMHPIAQHAARVWHKLPLAARVGAAAFVGSLLLLTIFVALPFAIYSHWRARRDAAYRSLETEDDDDDQSFDFGVDEKKAFEHKEPELYEPCPVYQETDTLVQPQNEQTSEQQEQQQ